MFNPSAQELLREIREAERYRDDHLHGVKRLVREYTGRWYRGDEGVGDGGNLGYGEEDINPEPFTYSFISNILPSLIDENPAVQVDVRRVIGHKMVGEAMEMAYEGWLQDVPFQEEHEKIVVDFLFFMGVSLRYLEDDTRWADGAVRPNTKRIDFHQFFIDPTASSIEEAEYMGHCYYVDLDDLMSDPDLKPEVLASLQASDDDRTGSDAMRFQPFDKPSFSALGRKRIKVYNVWLKRLNLLRVMSDQPNAEELYEPREWYGDAELGPYGIMKGYVVPGQVYPLSPLIAVHDQIRDMNAHARSASRSAAGRKTVIITDGAHPDLAEDIKHAQDREVIAVPGFSSTQVEQLELGGVTTQQYGYLEYLRQRLDRHSGLTETARGQAGSSDTATEAQIANEAYGNRIAFLKRRVREGVKDDLRAVGWFFFHTPGIIIPVSRRDAMTGMETEGLFFGGPVSGQDMGTWRDYNVKIEPYSMQRVSEALVQRRALDFANFIVTIAPQMPMMPWVRWMEVIRMVGEAMNHKNVDDFFIPQLLGMIPQDPMLLPSQAMAATDEPPNRFSQPGLGMKVPDGMNSNANAGVDAMRQQSGENFGGEYGGMRRDPNPFLTGGR